jgi:hypothetical protein
MVGDGAADPATAQENAADVFAVCEIGAFERE